MTFVESLLSADFCWCFGGGMGGGGVNAKTKLTRRMFFQCV